MAALCWRSFAGTLTFVPQCKGGLVFFCCRTLHIGGLLTGQKPFFSEWRESGSYFLQQEAKGPHCEWSEKGPSLGQRGGRGWWGSGGAGQRWPGCGGVGGSSVRSCEDALLSTAWFILKPHRGNCARQFIGRHTIHNIISEWYKSNALAERAN